MKPRTEDSFLHELEQARQQLAEAGRTVDISEDASNDGRLNFDFELPYSSLPKIRVEKWK